MKIKAILRLGLLCAIVMLALGSMRHEKAPANTLATMPLISATTTQTVAATPEPITEALPGVSVYVCKSAGAKKYHYKDTCRGLSNCKHEIVKMEKSDAENKGLGLCGWED